MDNLAFEMNEDAERKVVSEGKMNTFSRMVFEYPGGTIQWARYRNNANDYLSIEEEAFGSSLNSQRSQISLGTLRIKSSGLRAPHWHFNANEHGYLVQPEGGINFIRTFHKQKEDQGVNLPPNLAELVVNANYSQSPDNFVWRYFYDLKGSKEHRFPGGIIQLAQYWKNSSELSHNEKIFSEFLNQVGIINAQSSTEFDIHIGDVIFFPTGTQHYIKSTCDEDLLLILAFSTGDQLQTLDMDDYLQATADHILAQLFFKKQSEFEKIPQFKEDQAVNLP
ncbi:hypothetical protein MJG53_015781 [Ovis ammon polii x Ovis aries]|uniref:Uncharacterized protein n=1 Tax=Ovis ammon polii x Ovis aries TaxID=2918886 RepID=A0ACB9UBZ7_9CETA|nr:hypothetical protein MJG53_015781 [Ovis ammon polii x Ovis aries]